MAISFDKAFGVHPHAVLARSSRAELLATNIANADTPGYKAKDVNFADALAAATSGQKQPLVTTHNKHFAISQDPLYGLDQYRVPDQPDTGDGNTVDVQQERSLYVQNAMEYQASMRFLSGKIKGLKKALGGQGA
jgi:flagellar basal-body rod protein FlgB